MPSTPSSAKKPTGRFGPTQKDIATALGVSQSTVAFALNPEKKDRLLPETVARVEAMVAELGYHPQPHASMLRTRRSYTIGVLYGSGFYYAPQERLKYLAQRAIEAKYHIVTIDRNWFSRDEESIKRFIINSALEGVILCNLHAEIASNPIDFLTQRGIPTISLSSTDDGKIDSVHADVSDGFRQMTEHHLQQGSRRIALLLSQRTPGFVGPLKYTTRTRTDCFIAAIHAAGGTVTCDPSIAEMLGIKPASLPKGGNGIIGEIIYPEESPAFSGTMEMGRHVFNTLHSQGSLPDSLICSNDEIAVGAIGAAIELGIPVPQKIRISGADNDPLSRHCGLPITTIAQPSRELAHAAFDLLVSYIEDSSRPFPPPSPQSIVLPCTLVPRKSTLLTPPEL